MKSKAIHKLSGAALALLLIVPATPATAQQAAPAPAELDLNLAAALAAQGSDFGLATMTESAAEPEETAAATISPTEIRATAWTLEDGEEDPAADMKPEKERGVGRWLKKHWYVPILAAVALGAALDSGDDDASGEDD